jgi:hypothetical protein
MSGPDIPHVRAQRLGRNRAAEPAELRRRAAAEAKICIDCGDPSETQRCRRCARKVEANTERYRGSGVKGPPTKAATDLTDLRYATLELAAAVALYEELPMIGLTRSERERAIAPALDKLRLARGFIDDVRARNGVDVGHGDEDDAIGGGDEPRPSAWAERYLERKLRGICVRCGAERAVEDSVLGARCRRRSRLANRLRMRTVRAQGGA